MLIDNIDDKKNKIMKLSPDVFKDLWDIFFKSFNNHNDENKHMRHAL